MPTQLTAKRKGINTDLAGRVLNEEIRRDLKELGDRLISVYFEPLVRLWDDPVRFKTSVQSTSNRIVLSIVPTGSPEALKNWKLVNEGRAGGVTISARNASGLLKFLSGYNLKTSLAPAAPPGRHGSWVSKKSVTQGAVQAQDHVGEAKKRYRFDENFERAINRGYQRVWARLRRTSR